MSGTPVPAAPATRCLQNPVQTPLPCIYPWWRPGPARGGSFVDCTEIGTLFSCSSQILLTWIIQTDVKCFSKMETAVPFSSFSSPWFGLGAAWVTVGPGGAVASRGWAVAHAGIAPGCRQLPLRLRLGSPWPLGSGQVGGAAGVWWTLTRAPGWRCSRTAVCPRLVLRAPVCLRGTWVGCCVPRPDS